MSEGSARNGVFSFLFLFSLSFVWGPWELNILILCIVAILSELGLNKKAGRMAPSFPVPRSSYNPPVHRKSCWLIFNNSALSETNPDGHNFLVDMVLSCRCFNLSRGEPRF
jgi:hypothetical protein